MICIRCGYEYASELASCPLCSGEWQGWELLFAPHALDDLRAQVIGWIAQLPCPSVIEWMASSSGLRVRLYLPADVGSGVVLAWAAMSGQHSRWREVGKMTLSSSSQVLVPASRLPSLIASAEDSDPLLAIGSRMMNSVHKGKDVHLRAWLLGNESNLQGRLRTLVSYSYGTEGGVENNTPNPWGFQLNLLRSVFLVGAIIAGLTAGAWSAGWLASSIGLLGLVAGGSICIMTAWQIREWLV